MHLIRMLMEKTSQTRTHLTKTDIIRMHPKRMHMGSPTRMNPIEILLIATATATKRDSNQKMA